eukprot:6190747-Pleurochrysis_carterae.AAC.1
MPRLQSPRGPSSSSRTRTLCNVHINKNTTVISTSTAGRRTSRGLLSERNACAIRHVRIA